MIITPVGHIDPDLSKFRPPNINTLKSFKKKAVGTRWKPVPFENIVSEARVQIEVAGLHPVKESISVSWDRMTLYAGWDMPEENGVSKSFLIIPDYVQRHALIGVTGACVLVCSNGMVTGDHVFGRKHTIGLRLPRLILCGVERFVEESEGLSGFIDRLKEVNVTMNDADSFLMEAARQDIVAPSQLMKIWNSWAKPEHEEFQPRNAWSLYNAVTEQAKSWPTTRALRALKRFPEVIHG